MMMVVTVVVVVDVMVVMVDVMIMLHRRCVSAGGAENRHGEAQG
jgi:hypothetical protein